MFLLAFAAARRSITITNPYFVPDEVLTRALIAAATRGVRVVLLLPGVIDYNVVRHASRSLYGRLLEAGVEIHEYRAGLLHAKTVVVDGTWSAIGSCNLDHRSLALNPELSLIAYGPAVAARLHDVFTDDLRHSEVVDHARWRARPLWQRGLEALARPLRGQI